MGELINLREVKEKVQLEGGFDADNSALLCPNPQEWYSRAYLRPSVQDLRVIVNVKESTKISRMQFGDDGASTLYEFDCDFTDGDSKLDAITLETVPYSVMHSICQRDVEETFAVLEMQAGNENWRNATNFFRHYWDALADKVGEDIALAIWQGQNLNGFTVLGLEERIDASADTVEVATPANITVANVEEQFEALLVAAPNAIARKKSELRFYVSPSMANKIAISMAKNNTTNYVTTELGLTYAGIKISVQEGMSDDLIVLTRMNNLVYAVDALRDGENLKVRDLDVINVPKIRTRVDGKMGTLILNDEEILYVKEA